MVDCLRRDGSLTGRPQELTAISASGMLEDSGQVLCCINLIGSTSWKFSTIPPLLTLTLSNRSRKAVILSFPFGCQCAWRRSQKSEVRSQTACLKLSTINHQPSTIRVADM